MLNDDQYTHNVLTRASTQFHGDKVDIEDFTSAMQEFIEAGERIDRIKGALFYGRDFEYNAGTDNIPVHEPMFCDDQRHRHILHAVLGCATEGVEMCKAILKAQEEEVEIDDTNLQEEFGDCNWFRTLGLIQLNQTHVENITQNDAKLEERYGAVFSADAANNRDLDAERLVLEQSREDNDDD